MVSVDVALRPRGIEDLLKALSEGRVQEEYELHVFHLLGGVAIAAEGTGLFRPPAWGEECLDPKSGPDGGVVDFLLGIAEALARLDADAEEEKYYFSEHDYSITLVRRASKLVLTATLEMGDYPSTPPLVVDFDEFYTALACAAKRFRAALAPWDDILLAYPVVSSVLGRIDRLAERCPSED